MARMSVSSRLSWRRRHLAPESLLHPADPAVQSLVQSLVSASKDISHLKQSAMSQRANSKAIAWRVGLLSPLFEEVRDSGVWIPPSALLAFRQLRSLFRNVKALISDCRHSSTLLLLMDQDLLASHFCDLSHAIAAALVSLPCELLDVSEEVREQVALVERLARAAEPRNHPDEEQLRQEVLSVMAEFETQTSPDPATLKHIFESLSFNDAIACERELALLEKEKERLRDEQLFPEIPNINNLISFVRYARCILFGLAPQQLVATSCRKYVLSPSASMRRVVLLAKPDEEAGPSGGGATIPDDFRCPISLDLMVDPVIVASGQTYERASIARWLDEGHTTCPKSGMKLLHNNLIPNSNLRRLISKWCAENDFVLEPADKAAAAKLSRTEEMPPNSKAALEATKLTAEFLVGKLGARGASTEVQRQAAHELRLLAKEGADNRACIAAAGAVPSLAAVLAATSDGQTQENAVTALLNLSIYEPNKALIMHVDAGALPAIVAVLAAGLTLEARENAAAALFSLTAAKEHRVAVGGAPGVFDGLLELLHVGTLRGKRDAAASLFNLALHADHAAAMLTRHAAAACVARALKGEHADDLAGEVVAVLGLFSRKGDGLAAVSAELPDVLPALLRVASTGSDKAKEQLVSLLLSACSRSDPEGSAAELRHQLRLFPALFTSLQRIVTSGSPRAQRKAAALLGILQRYA